MTKARWTNLGLAMLLTGCGNVVRTDYAQLGLVQVWGTVTLDGQPLVGGIVEFVSPDQSYSIGKTDDRGRYEMMFNSEQKGVPPGPKVVRVSSSGSLVAEDSSPVEGAAVSVSSRELVLACYNADSQLTVVIVGRSQRVDFELHSGGEP